MNLSDIAKQIVLRNARLRGGVQSGGMRAGMRAGCLACSQGGCASCGGMRAGMLAGARKSKLVQDKPKQKRAPSKWILFVKEVRAQNPHLSYKEALVEASKIYQKDCKKTQTKRCQKFEKDPSTGKKKCKTYSCQF